MKVGKQSIGMRFFKIALSVILIIGAPVQARMNSEVNPNAEVLKAAFLINFCKFIDWPEGSFENPQSPIVIGILNENSLMKVFDSAKGFQTRGRPIIAKKLDDIEDDESLHLLFLNDHRITVIQKALERVGGSPVLTVGDGFTEDLTRRVMINLFESQAKLRFSVQLGLTEEAGIWVSSQLLALGDVITSNSNRSNLQWTQDR